MTYNGMVINKPDDNINTLINQAILDKYDENEEAYTHIKAEQEQRDMENKPKYFKTLKLDPQIKRAIDPKGLIKINTSQTYVPCIYTDQNTKFRINFGATAFRNHQPEFQNGILFPYEGAFEDLLYKEDDFRDKIGLEDEAHY